MTSWRETTSESAQQAMEALLNAVLPFAEQTLGRYGEMYPFGATIDAGGQIATLATDPGLGDQPPIDAVIEALHAAAASVRDSADAIALVADVTIDDGDAVRVELEHREGSALVVIAPYERDGDAVTIGELGIAAGTRRVW